MNPVQIILALLAYLWCLAEPFVIMAGAVPVTNIMWSWFWAGLWILALLTGICASPTE
jgi:hypothetical protein